MNVPLPPCAGARAEHSGPRVSPRGRGGGALRGRVRAHCARHARAGRARQLRATAGVCHLSAADAHGKDTLL